MKNYRGWSFLGKDKKELKKVEGVSLSGGVSKSFKLVFHLCPGRMNSAAVSLSHSLKVTNCSHESP